MCFFFFSNFVILSTLFYVANLFTCTCIVHGGIIPVLLLTNLQGAMALWFNIFCYDVNISKINYFKENYKDFVDHHGLYTLFPGNVGFEIVLLNTKLWINWWKGFEKPIPYFSFRRGHDPSFEQAFSPTDSLCEV